jgi:hypothetical protein
MADSSNNNKAPGSVAEILDAKKRVLAACHQVEAGILAGGEVEEAVEPNKGALKAAFEGMVALNPVGAAAAQGIDVKGDGQREFARLKAAMGGEYEAMKGAILGAIEKRKAEKGEGGDPSEALADMYCDFLSASSCAVGLGWAGLVWFGFGLVWFR